MDLIIKNMNKNHWKDISNIYRQGIVSENATFQSEVPSFEEWDESHIDSCRLVAMLGETVVAWAALSSVSKRSVYNGVAAVSIYVNKENQNQKIGSRLLQELIKESEKHGFWTLESCICEENKKSVALHEKCGFRIVGYREKIGKTNLGQWKNVVLMERRSTVVHI